MGHQDPNIRHAGRHFGASNIEHQKFAQPLRAVAVGLAAHRSIDTGLPVLLADLLPEGLR